MGYAALCARLPGLAEAHRLLAREAARALLG
jgi:hypothetical protein